jgi:outer membrane biosynthesis protein TonB
MSDKNKNIRKLLMDIFRYHRNEMSGDERNSLEREFQKDPFTEEAGEGYRSVTEQEALKDITDLQKRLNRKTSGRSGFIFYRFAASIAILIAVSAIFVFIDRGRQPAQLAENSIQAPIPVTPENQPSAEQITKETSTKREALKTEKKSDGSMAGSSGAKQKKSSATKSEPALAENMNIDSIPAIKEVPPEIYYSDKSLSAPARAMAKDRSDSLSEVVVVGYGVSDDEAVAEKADAGLIAPQPSTGKLKFNKYIQDNLHRPDSSTTGQRVVVVLNFLVKTDGSIDSIKIVRSPGKLFSDEAIRVLKSGPSWKPALENGRAVEEEVRIRIVFK